MLPLPGGRLMLVGLTGKKKKVDSSVSDQSRYKLKKKPKKKKPKSLTEVGVVVFSCICAGGSRRRQWGLATCVLKAPC